MTTPSANEKVYLYIYFFKLETRLDRQVFNKSGSFDKLLDRLRRPLSGSAVSQQDPRRRRHTVHTRATREQCSRVRVFRSRSARGRVLCGHTRRGPSGPHQSVPDQHGLRAGAHVQRRVRAGESPLGRGVQALAASVARHISEFEQDAAAGGAQDDHRHGASHRHVQAHELARRAQDHGRDQESRRLGRHRARQLSGSYSSNCFLDSLRISFRSSSLIYVYLKLRSCKTCFIVPT
jgi:hypothetical protein